MLIKEKLLDVKLPECQGMFSSFVESYFMDILLIESELKKLAFCIVMSQNRSRGRISKKKQKHSRDINQGSKFFKMD